MVAMLAAGAVGILVVAAVGTSLAEVAILLVVASIRAHRVRVVLQRMAELQLRRRRARLGHRGLLLARGWYRGWRRRRTLRSLDMFGRRRRDIRTGWDLRRRKILGSADLSGKRGHRAALLVRKIRIF